MTTKKERILATALELFAHRGYDATPTSAIAKHAGVSEGLLFKHFGNKQGVLDAILAEGERRANLLVAPIIAETNPRIVIRKYIELPFEVPEESYDFWRLIFQLKWDADYDHNKHTVALRKRLEAVFSDLGKVDPALETEMLMQLVDAASIALLQGSLEKPTAYRDFLLRKYLS